MGNVLKGAKVSATIKLSPPPPYQAQLATLMSRPPDSDDWLHEQKFDGYRIGLRTEGGDVRLWSRRGQDWTAEFRSVATSAVTLGRRQALLDGEVAVVLPTGATSFQGLQHRRPETPLTYFVFDLLCLDGVDFRAMPVEERKARLRQLTEEIGEPAIRYSDHVIGNGVTFFHGACALGLEGIVSKRRNAPYRIGRNTDWQKTKCLHRQELVIGGFTDPEGSRESIGALLVGYYDEGRLRLAGNVGTGAGWTAAFLRKLRQKLEGIETDSSPFEPPVNDSWLRRNAHWARPELVVEVAFTEWTNDGHIRHPSMQGLRADKDPHDVRRERPAASKEGS